MREETRQNLFNYEAPPPPGAWDHIAAALDAKTSAPVRRFPIWVKYAASVLLLISVAIIWYQVRSREQNKAAAISRTQTIPGEGGVTLPSAPAPEENASPASTDHSTSATVPSSNGFHSAPDDRDRARYSPVQRSLAHTALYSPSQMAQSFERKLAGETQTDILNENYIYLTSGEGQPIRVSRKLASAFLTELGLNNEQPPSNEILLLSEKIRTWKTRLAETSFVPTTSNIMDMMLLMEMLEEN